MADMKLDGRGEVDVVRQDRDLEVGGLGEGFAGAQTSPTHPR